MIIKMDTNNLDERKKLLNEIIEFATDKLPYKYEEYYFNDEQIYKILLYVAKYHNVVHCKTRPILKISSNSSHKIESYKGSKSHVIKLGFCLKKDWSETPLVFYIKEDIVEYNMWDL